MIYIGYQGIGKSTLGGVDKFIDLESGNFWIDGKRADDWYKPYCKIAEHLSAQGFIVFVSSHEVVREQLRKSKERVGVIYPSFELKDAWIERLKVRYETTQLEKDYKAYMNAVDKYFENIRDLSREKFYHITLNSMDYDLKEIIYKSGYFDLSTAGLE